MIGAMFWGLLVSTLVLAVLVAGAVFLLLWPVSMIRIVTFIQI